MKKTLLALIMLTVSIMVYCVGNFAAGLYFTANDVFYGYGAIVGGGVMLALYIELLKTC